MSVNCHRVVMDYVTISLDHSSAYAQYQHFILRENVEVRTTFFEYFQNLRRQRENHETIFYDKGEDTESTPVIFKMVKQWE